MKHENVQDLISSKEETKVTLNLLGFCFYCHDKKQPFPRQFVFTSLFDTTLVARRDRMRKSRFDIEAQGNSDMKTNN